MTDYTKSTNFATKDNLSSGNALKIVKGTEIDTEFNNIATAIATKADLASPTFTGTPTLPTGTIATTQSFANSTTAIATTAFVQAALAALYPVGSIYTNAAVSTNPATLLGFGTWTAFGAGRVMVGFDSGNALFDTAEETGGSADAITVSHTHTFTGDALAAHSHTLALRTLGASPSSPNFPMADVQGPTPGSINTGSTSGGTPSGTISTTGSSGTNANYQPYITVYMWKRTV
tara:strand:- start:1337 stop:2035 length:699 start_codon:yes stop_codon:yes gene_type:complete